MQHFPRNLFGEGFTITEGKLSVSSINNCLFGVSRVVDAPPPNQELDPREEKGHLDQ